MGAGSGFLLEGTEIVGLVSSVVASLGRARTAGPELRDLPLTVTESPTLTLGADELKTIVVITRSCISAWLLTAEGSVTLTGVTSVAKLGPVVASATYAAGTFVHEPLAPTEARDSRNTAPVVARRDQACIIQF